MRGAKHKRREGARKVRVYLRRDPVTGREKQMSENVYGDAKAAEEVLPDLIVNKVSRVDAMGVSLGQLHDQWLAECERVELYPATRRADRRQWPGVFTSATTRLMPLEGGNEVVHPDPTLAEVEVGP
jgi:hypothetical protein